MGNGNVWSAASIEKGIITPKGGNHDPQISNNPCSFSSRGYQLTSKILDRSSARIKIMIQKDLRWSFCDQPADIIQSRITVEAVISALRIDHRHAINRVGIPVDTSCFEDSIIFFGYLSSSLHPFSRPVCL